MDALAPKTGPARLESCVHHHPPAAPAPAPAPVRAHAPKPKPKPRPHARVHKRPQQGKPQPSPPQPSPPQPPPPPPPQSVEQKRPSPVSVQQQQPHPHVVVEELPDEQHEENSDWGVRDMYIRELFARAESTAENAVRCDEKEQYFEAFELYWVVVDLYYEIIPFLSPEEGSDVHERIKMYTERCQVIREAFEEDLDDVDENQHSAAEQTIIQSHNEQYNQHTVNNTVYASYTRVENVSVSKPAFHLQKTTSKHRIAAPLPARKKASAARPPQAQQHQQHAQHAHKLKPPTRPLPPVPDASADGADVDADGDAPHAVLDSVGASNGEPHGADGVLQRAPFPDYMNEKPLAAIPDAPRGGALGLSSSTQAHRSSLSRPISRSAVRASTSSVSRERVAEMQERVKLMQECLNNFTVKRKHLGPARALELLLTTLNANTFGDLKRLEPLAAGLEHKWATELEVLLSMLQEIKEVRPGDGLAVREDIATNLPALEKCDRSVRLTMRSFSALSGHVRYVDRDGGGGNEGRSRRRWWVKVPVVEKGGLPEAVRRTVEEAEKEMRSVFKICHEINVEVVKTMPVPASFVENLPKHARSLIPRELKEGLTTWGMFKVSDYMKDRKLWHKEAAKEITSSLEKVALIWEAKASNKSFLSRTFDIRGDRFHQAVTAFRRCQNAIRDLRREWPTMQHTELDMSKIQNNDDIGLAGLEAYSRALESRAYRLLTRIRELLDADDEEKKKKGVVGGKGKKKKEGRKRS
eukprot:gb/GEZJ01002119.1/.p1 GENE.gb/GEZJ01002119.1/~~gb/GEZJ01002119.1/.p1  ORF type:complete len:871 (-),score=157.06 gb/GEZJ01002119.1/:1114-3372(-)